MEKSLSFPSSVPQDANLTSGSDPIPQIQSNSMDQSSYTSPPHPQARPLVDQQPPEPAHASSFSHLPDHFSGFPYDEAVVVDEHNLIPPPSTADDGQLEATSSQFNSTGAESQTIDVAAAAATAGDSERYPDDERLDYNIAVYKLTAHHAAIKGDWETAEYCFDKKAFGVTDPITRDKENILHIAAGSKNAVFVEKMINRMTSADMALQNKHGDTALCFAAASGVTSIAVLIVDKNEHLPLIRGFGNVTPLFMAISYKHREMTSYLLSVTDLNQLNPQEQIELLIATIHSDFYDVSLEILERNPNLAVMRDTKNNNDTALHVLARKKQSAISSRAELNIWKKCINYCIKGIYNKDLMTTLAHKLVRYLWRHVIVNLTEEEMLEFIKYPTRLMHDAARAGNVEFLILLISTDAEIAWEEDDDGKSIFHVAVENRLENVFNLIYEVGGLKSFSTKNRTTVKEKYNMLHLAAKLAPSNHLNRVSGAALQMQRELLWFKEVEKIVLPSQLEAKSGDPLQLTPRELFTKEHKDLRKDGEMWMKDTANSCMLVATLIATVVFAAAFTVPGGNDNTGTPIFRRKHWFSVFIISDAFALISSSTSILMFMSILTSRYAEDDFLHSLPSQLLFGLMSLFISIVCMVVAFSATFFMLYHERPDNWVPETVAAMAIIPVSCFCALQFKLWVDTFHNTYVSRFLFKPRRQRVLSPLAYTVADYLRDKKIKMELKSSL